jgi:hypothetical protein
LWDILDFTAHVSQSPKDRVFELQSTNWSLTNNPGLILREHLLKPGSRDAAMLERFFASGQSTVSKARTVPLAL